MAMKLCLVPGDARARAVFTEAPWRERWTEVLDPAEADAAAEGLALVRLDTGGTVPRAAGPKLALEIGELDQLEALSEAPDGGGWAAVYFRPSRLAVLDAERRRRVTLVAARALRAGETLTDADMVESRAGEGVDAGLRSRLVGRGLAYDLAAGQPVTFGMLDE